MTTETQPTTAPIGAPADARTAEAGAARRAAAGYVLVLVSALVAQAFANVIEYAISRGMNMESIGRIAVTVSLTRLGFYAIGALLLIVALRAVGATRGGAFPASLARIAAGLYAIAALDYVVLSLLSVFVEPVDRQAFQAAQQWGAFGALLASSIAHGLTAYTVDFLATDAGQPPPAALKLVVLALAGWQILFALLSNILGMQLITRSTQWAWRAVSLVEVIALYGLLILLVRLAAAAIARRASA